jgi:hypothetical protein
VARSLQQISGPKTFDPGPNDVVVVTPIRNSSYWLPLYLAHHRKLGVKGFVFIDTGSQDGTLELLAHEPDAIVLNTDQSIRKENKFREIAATRYAAGAWCLFVDSDEMFDFEAADSMMLPDLTKQLAAHGFTAMLALMIDLFPKGSLASFAHADFEQAIRDFVYFEPDSIEFLDYHDHRINFHAHLAHNIIASPETRLGFGGVRYRVFGEYPCLTKHPLVRVLPGIVPGRHPHFSTGVRVADMQAIVRHYKFTNNPILRDSYTVCNSTWNHGEDRKRLGVFEKLPALELFSDRSQLYDGIKDLRRIGLIP